MKAGPAAALVLVLLISIALPLALWNAQCSVEPTTRYSVTHGLKSGGCTAAVSETVIIALAIGVSWPLRRAIPLGAIALAVLLAGAVVLTAGVWAALCPACEASEDESRSHYFTLAWRIGGSIAGAWIAAIGLGALAGSAIAWLWRRRAPRPT